MNQIQANKKYREKLKKDNKIKQLNFEMHEKDLDLLKRFKKVYGKYKNDKLRLLLDNYETS